MTANWPKLILSIFLAGEFVACQSIPSDFNSTSVVETTPLTLVDPVSLNTIEKNIHQLVNQHRQAKNLPSLKFDETIAQQARIHSERMAAKTIPFSEQGLQEMAQFINRSIPYEKIGKNISLTQNTQEPGKLAVETWLDRGNSRQNIEGDFELTGIGVARNSQGEYYFTQIFLKPTPVVSSPVPSSPVLPSRNSSLKTNSIIALEEETHKQVNQYRISQNKPPLRLDPRISSEARLFSEKMAQGKAAFSHDGFEERVKAIEKLIPLVTAGENLAFNQGYNDPVRVAVEGWIKSPGHQDNMVGDFDLTGIGIAKNAKGEYYFTQLFVKKR